jgi:hypothetical protein
MSEVTALEKIADAYEGKPIIRALIQVAISPIPYGIGSAIDAGLTARIEHMREERLRTFFQELGSGSRELTDDLIHEDDFLHAYFSTLKAATNTQKKEKIRLFARLLLEAARKRRIDIDVYSEFLSILEDLSVRELHILLILKRFEDSHPYATKATGELENDLQRASRFWDAFEEAIRTECRIDPDTLRAVLNRLNRTGLYESFTWAIGYSGGQGILTPLFEEFINWIGANEAELAQ